MPSRLLHTARNTRFGAALVSATAVCIFSAVPVYFALDYRDHHRHSLAGEAERHASSRILQAQALLDRARTMPGIVALTISQAGTPARFETTVRNLLSMSGIVESVNIASTAGPAAVIQRDPADQREPVQVLFQPTSTLTQTRKAVVGFAEGSLLITEALAEVDERGKTRFWGYLTAEASLGHLVHELQLRTLVNAGFGVQFGVQWQAGGAQSIIYSGGNLDDPGVSRSLRLIGDELLTLRVVPPRVALSGLPAMAGGGLAIAGLLLFMLTYHLLRRPQQLEREVEARTQEIAAEKAALQKEIAARIQAESYLERSHALLDSIFEHIPGMIVLKRVADLRVARINRSAERMLARSRDFLSGRNNEEIYPPALADLLTQGDLDALQQPGLVDLPVQRVSMPGAETRWIGYHKTALRDRDGTAEYILEFGEDLTERETLDRRIKEHLHFLEQLIEAFPGPVFSKDSTGRYLAVNAPFEEFIGRPRAEILGKSVFAVAPRELAEEYERADRELLATGGKQIYESQVERADGSLAETMFHKAVFRNSDGSSGGIVGIALDISERKNAERRVAKLNRVLTVLSAINHLIIYTRDRDRLLNDARRILQEKGEFPAVWIRVGAGNAAQVIADAAIAEHARQICDEIENPERRCWPQRRLECQTLDCCNPLLAAELKTRGLQSLLHLPLRSNDADWGDIGILGAVGQAFTAEEQSLLEELAGNLAFALDALHQEEMRKDAEAKLELSARVFENNSEGIIITDAANRILMVNKAFSTVTGYSAGEVIGRTPSMLNSGRHSGEFFDQIQSILQTEGEWRGEVINRRKNGEEFPEWLTLSLVRNEDGEVANHVAVFSDLTARRKIEERLDFLTHYDSLTSLPNRDHFHAHLEQTIIEAGIDDKRVAVVYFDLDRFKLINETIGHAAGDRLLVEVSARLVTAAGNKSDVARLGGDQFALVIGALASSEEAAKRVHGIRELLHESFESDGQEIHISSSIGISIFPEDGVDAETLIRNADTALYKAIEDGGNTYRFFRQEMNERAAERVRLEGRLHHALERGELSVNFQPFVATDSGRVVGAEALLRWRCEELGGNVSPVVFIPLLEEIGLIGQVGEWVLHKACEEVRRWQMVAGEQLFVAVNISALQLTADFPHLVARAIAEYGIAPTQLEIELTESAIMRDADHGIRILHELKALGVKLSIDDFGTGYSSLSYLKRLPMTTLKIDQSFVRDIPDDAEAVSITRAILALGHSLHLNIVAEGVETPAQVAFLCENGCDLLQGYHFSRPVAAAEFVHFLSERSEFELPASGQRPLQLMSAARLKVH